MKNTKQEIENTLKELREQVREKLNNSYALDFVNEASATDSAYLSDSLSEFADNNTSIYYNEQREYFNENASECEDALLELYDSESIADIIKNEGLDSLICKAGAFCEIKDKAIKGAILFAFIDEDCEMIDCKIFTTEQQAKDYLNDSFTEEE